MPSGHSYPAHGCPSVETLRYTSFRVPAAAYQPAGRPESAPDPVRATASRVKGIEWMLESTVRVRTIPKVGRPDGRMFGSQVRFATAIFFLHPRAQYRASFGFQYASVPFSFSLCCA